jgi:SAM-dependent methyltransferase
MIERYFDQKHNRLVFIENKANAEFWNEKWDSYNFKRIIKSSAKNRLLLKTTRKYLGTGSKILEGGCGLGGKVYCLNIHGYDVYGLDFAINAVKKIRRAFPELKVYVGDIRDLPFEDNYFDGYWSIGVIEHFYEGFLYISREMYRVIKPNGFLFLTFPSMSIIRRFKTRLGCYPIWNGQRKKDFYQFALDPSAVQKEFELLGFTLKEKTGVDGLKGFKDEIELVKPLLQRVYDSQSLIFKVIQYGFNLFFSSIFGHNTLLVLRKN